MSWGGKREGAGRPKLKESTKVLRIPESRVDEVKRLIASSSSNKIPLYGCSVKAGFPSPADDYIEDYLDLNQFLIKHPSATFMVKAQGESMIGAAIQPGDILIVDRSLEPSHGKIVIASVEGELTVKRLYKKDGIIKLMPENPDYEPIDISNNPDAAIWGVVTNVIHQLG